MPLGKRAGLVAAVAVLSASALGFEVLQVRVLSVSLGHGIAATVISLALLGYGASGPFLGFVQDRARDLDAGFAWSALLFGASALLCHVAAQALPLTPMALGWEPTQWLLFAGVYLVLAVPFFFAGTGVGLALRLRPRQVPAIYRADLLGAGAGALAVVPLLVVLDPAQCLRAVACGGALSAALVAWNGAGARPRKHILALAGALLIGAALTPASRLEPRLSPYRPLRQALRAPGSEIASDRWSPLGRVTSVTSPRVPLRHAPGLGLTCPDPVPAQMGVYVDGGFAGAIDPELPGAPAAYRDCLPSALPYRLLPPRPRVLALGLAGTSALADALRHEAASLDLVEPHGLLAESTLRLAGVRPGPLPGGATLRLWPDTPRSVIAGLDRTFDLILASGHTGAGDLTTVATGTEAYDLTVEAFHAYLALLRPRGILWLEGSWEVPPWSSLKLLLTAREALERSGAQRPQEHLALLRTWNTTALLVTRSPLDPDRIGAIREFALRRGVDLAHLPGLRREEANRFTRLESPYLFDGAHQLLGPQRQEFLHRHKFHLSPATDDRPYAHRFFRWASLPELWRERVRSGTARLDWGYLLGWGAVLQAVLLGLVFIFVPLAILHHCRKAKGKSAFHGLAVYHGALGLGFLMVEIATLKRLTLFLGHPLLASGVTIAAFLTAAGLGSGVCRRLLQAHSSRRVALGSCLGVAALAAVFFACLPQLTRLAGLHAAPRFALAAALVAPLAFVMGIPFPAGIARTHAVSAHQVPWCWGVNGFASVWSATLAAVLALHLGLSGLGYLGSGLYVVAALAAWRWQE